MAMADGESHNFNNATIETKLLRLKFPPQKLYFEYKFELDIPERQDLIRHLEQAPFYILSNEDITFNTGILGRTPHAVKLMLFRIQQDLHIGVYIKLEASPGQNIEVEEIKAIFMEDNLERNSGTSSQFMSTKEQDSRNNGHQPLNKQYKAEFFQHDKTTFNVSFVKQIPTSVDLQELRQYKYYESCTYSGFTQPWPSNEFKAIISLKISWILHSTIVDKTEAVVDCIKKHSSLLDTSSYFMSQDCSDVHLQINETVIPAHKLILSAKSDYFKKMFSIPMRESANSVVSVYEDEILFKEVLRYIYLGKVNSLEKYAKELFILADKYLIQDLVDLCEKHLIENISVDTAEDLYMLCKTLGNGAMAKRVETFILWNSEQFPECELVKKFNAQLLNNTGTNVNGK